MVQCACITAAQKVLSPISDTEREALEAGNVWWDAELLSVKPDWSSFQALDEPVFLYEEETRDDLSGYEKAYVS